MAGENLPPSNMYDMLHIRMACLHHALEWAEAQCVETTPADEVLTLAQKFFDWVMFKEGPGITPSAPVPYDPTADLDRLRKGTGEPPDWT